MRRGVVKPWVVVTLGCGVTWACLLAALAVGRFAGDARGFLCAGAAFQRPAALADVPVVSQWGYDGQFYAVVATDPLLLKDDTRRYLDSPAYRASRVGAPLLAWLLGLGQPRAAVWFYLLLCWAGALALVGLAAAWLAERGGSPWWALTVGVSGGVAASMLRATPDALALALAVAGLWLLARERLPWAVGLLVAATLIRETMVLVATGGAVAELFAGRRRAAALLAVVPGGVYGAWRAVVALHLEGSPLATGGNLGVPFAWLATKLTSLARGGAGAVGMELWGVLAIVAGLGGAVVLVRDPLRQAAAAAFVLFALLSVGLASQVMVEAYAYARVLLPLPVLGLLVASGTRPLARLWFYFLAAFQALVGLAMVRVELGSTFPALANLKGYLFS
jgi:hypothetical protein